MLIPDFLALVGDSADGYPGISGIGKTRRSPAVEPVRTNGSFSGEGPGQTS